MGQEGRDRPCPANQKACLHLPWAHLVAIASSPNPPHQPFSQNYRDKLGTSGSHL
jgi:hypothetical protein